MLENILWNLFEETGRIDVFMAYREYKENKRELKKDDIEQTYTIKKVVNK